MYREKAGHRLREHKRWEESERKKLGTGDIFCKSCGATVSGKHTYCPKCGSILLGDNKAKYKERTTHKKNKAEKQNSKDLFKEFNLSVDNKTKNAKIRDVWKKVDLKRTHILLIVLIVIILAVSVVLVTVPRTLSSLKLGLASATGLTLVDNDKSEGRIIRIGFDEYRVVFSIPQDKINEDFRKNRKRGSRSDEYLMSNNEYIVDFANQLKKSAIDNESDIVPYIINFVQSLPYEMDLEVGFDEYPKYPTETLFEGRGDCEDSSYLLYSLLEALKYDVILIFIPKHVMVGISGTECKGCSYVPHNDKKYYFIETTNTGFGIGDFPKDKEGDIKDIIKTENTEDYNSIRCFKEKKSYDVEEEYWVDVPYTEKIEYTEKIPIEKEVGFKYSVGKGYWKQRGGLDCVTRGMGWHCYDVWNSLTNEESKEGIFRYSYEVDGTARVQKYEWETITLGAGETKKIPAVIFDIKENDKIASITLNVKPPSRTVVEYREEKRIKEVPKTKREKRTRTVTRYYFKDRCV